MPAMIAAVCDPCSGELLAIQRTFLLPDGSGKVGFKAKSAIPHTHGDGDV